MEEADPVPTSGDNVHNKLQTNSMYLDHGINRGVDMHCLLNWKASWLHVILQIIQIFIPINKENI
jgi:hypothetical protein